jgi:Holliday junction resolvase RusA-like endonuclease
LFFSGPRHPAVRRRHDPDKLERPVYDSLTGVIFDDDGRIVHNDTWKKWGKRPGVHVLVRELPE